MNTPFHYIAYGLRIASSKPLNHLKQTCEKINAIDLSIEWTSSFQVQPKSAPEWTKIPQGVVWTLPDVACYTCLEGKKLIIQPLTEDWERVESQIYGPVINLLLIQRGKFSFHCASILSPQGKAWVIMGGMSLGKTHLALQLQGLGYTILSDDTLRIDASGQQALGFASIPVIGIRSSSFESLKKYNSNNTRKSRYQLSRYLLDFHEEFVSQPIPIEGFIVLEQDTENHLEPMEKGSFFKFLMDRGIMRQVIPFLEKEAMYFRLTSFLSNRIPVYRWKHNQKATPQDLSPLLDLINSGDTADLPR